MRDVVLVIAGFGNHLARPIMRERHRPDMSEEEVGWGQTARRCRSKSMLRVLALLAAALTVGSLLRLPMPPPCLRGHRAAARLPARVPVPV